MNVGRKLLLSLHYVQLSSTEIGFLPIAAPVANGVKKTTAIKLVQIIVSGPAFSTRQYNRSQPNVVAFKNRSWSRFPQHWYNYV